MFLKSLTIKMACEVQAIMFFKCNYFLKISFACFNTIEHFRKFFHSFS